MTIEENTLLNKVTCADVLQGLAQIPDEAVQLAITSPPYNLQKNYEKHEDALEDTQYLEWMKSVWSATNRVLADGGRLCINVGENKRQNISQPHFSAFISQCVDLGMLYRGTVIWDKNSAAKHCAWGSWQSCSNPHVVPRHEYILIFSKGQWKLDGERDNTDIIDKDFITCTRSVWRMGTESKKAIGHPAPFPRELPRRLIQFLSYRGNTVLDMFAGSGTVGVVASSLDRDFILIDSSMQYCQIAKRRIEEACSLFNGSVEIVDLQ
jgi:site-specific DNA-methyltransferase (adenine-specific)